MILARGTLLSLALLVMCGSPVNSLLLAPTVRVARPTPLVPPHRIAAAAVRASADVDQKEIITFTEAALEQLITLREKQGLEEIVLRMGVRAGGCSGMSYVMDFTNSDDVSEQVKKRGEAREKSSGE